MTTAPCPCLSRSTLLLTRRVSLIRLLMLCLPLLAMLAALPQLRAQELAPIDLRQPPQQWQSLFTALASHPRIESDFTELRYFPFRRFPRQLEGRMVFDHGRGMALEYLSPSRYTVFVQPQGGIRIVRGADTDEVPQNAASATMLRLMPQLMVFSPKALADTFNARGQMQEGGNWQLSLKPPRIGDLPGVQEIRMSGSGDQLTQLVLVRGTNERSEINITGTRFPPQEAPQSIQWPSAESNAQADASAEAEAEAEAK